MISALENRISEIWKLLQRAERVHEPERTWRVLLLLWTLDHMGDLPPAGMALRELATRRLDVGRRAEREFLRVWPLVCPDSPLDKAIRAERKALFDRLKAYILGCEVVLFLDSEAAASLGARKSMDPVVRRLLEPAYRKLLVASDALQENQR